VEQWTEKIKAFASHMVRRYHPNYIFHSWHGALDRASVVDDYRRQFLALLPATTTIATDKEETLTLNLSILNF
jgi:hypothetical protein